MAALLATVVVFGWGCGSEPNFTAEEFVVAANENGAGVVLGEPLSASGSEDELYVLRLGGPENAPAPAPAPGVDAGHGGGSLKVNASEEEANAEYERCEGAVTLICYRAANVSVVFEGLTPEERDRLDRAFEAIAEGDGS